MRGSEHGRPPPQRGRAPKPNGAGSASTPRRARRCCSCARHPSASSSSTPIPRCAGFYLSFTDFDLLRNDGDWVGLDNYKTLLQDALFWNALWITFKYVIINIGIQTVLALAIAVLMHRLTQSTSCAGSS